MASIDVIIPVYRPGKKLNELLEVLERQTVKPERIILVHTGPVLKGEPDYDADEVIEWDGAESGKPGTAGELGKAGEPGTAGEPGKAGTAGELRKNGVPGDSGKGCKKILCVIPAGQFNHGGSRNLGASLSAAEAMVFMTQDAVPADKRLLEKLEEALDGKYSDSKCFDGEDSESEYSGSKCSDGEHSAGKYHNGGRVSTEGIPVGAVYARQLPCRDCHALERYIREFNYPEKTEFRTLADIPARGIKTFCNSNVCAAYRRSVFDRLGGFEQRVIFNEDMLFGAKAILQGYGIVYLAETGVYHSHNLGLADQFQRNFDNGVSQAEHPEVFRTVSSEKEGMKLVNYCMSRMRKDGRWYLAPYFLLNCAFRYAGFFLGKRYQKLPASLVRACSLSKGYWREQR